MVIEIDNKQILQVTFMKSKNKNKTLEQINKFSNRIVIHIKMIINNLNKKG